MLVQYSQIVLDIVDGIPLRAEMGDFLAGLPLVVERGYFLPKEEELLFSFYVDYLRVRGDLLEMVRASQEVFERNADDESWNVRMGCFAIGFAAALVLMRVGTFAVEVADSGKVVMSKLDDAELRYGLKRKSFATLYKNLTDPQNAIAFYEAVRFYEVHLEDIDTLAADGEMKLLVDLLKEEYALLDYRKRDALVRRLKYRWFSLKRHSVSGYRKTMFHIFRLSGCRIAELKQPHLAKYDKNVSSEMVREMEAVLLPGDIIVTRHQDALSNLFLPGYWPHVALFVGSAYQRSELLAGEQEDGFNVVEAKKDGVKSRLLEETLYVDEFLVIRPFLSNADMAEVLERAISHVGKRYDFIFDFTSSDRLACTEVVFRSFDGVAGVSFKLIDKVRRMCLPTEELISQCLEMASFELKYLYLNDRAQLLEGDEALRALLEQQNKTS